MDEDIQEQILSELRKMRKTNQWMSVFLAIVLVVVVGWAFIRIPPQTANSWVEVRSAMHRSDYQKALQLTQKLAAEHPDDYYAHEYLGIIHLAMGDVAKAEAEYARAYELFPEEETRKKLDAIRKRRENDAGKAEHK